MIWHRESDVRRWVRTQKGVKVRWVEPSMGSTIGTPDAWFHIYVAGQCWPTTVWVELKLADLDDGNVRFTVRPEQKRTIRALKSEGGVVFILAGIRKGRGLWLMDPVESVLAGCVDVSKSSEEKTAVFLGQEEFDLIQGVMVLLGL